jgi:hypothetical protein
MGTAEEPAVGLYAMPDHATAAVLAERGERVDRTLERVEDVCIPCDHLERLVVLVPAYLTAAHAHLVPPTLDANAFGSDTFETTSIVVSRGPFVARSACVTIAKHRPRSSITGRRRT